MKVKRFLIKESDIIPIDYFLWVQFSSHPGIFSAKHELMKTRLANPRACCVYVPFVTISGSRTVGVAFSGTEREEKYKTWQINKKRARIELF